jgi:thymidylate synthase (FAD)
MKIIEPSFRLSTPYQDGLLRSDGICLLRFIELQARISHRSEEKRTKDSWERFIPAVVGQHGDWSVTEHASITCTVRVSRGTTHELVRHRISSYTQESTRFVRYKDLEFLYPANAPEGCFANWDLCIEQAERTYLDLLTAGWRPQEARSVLPNALAATLAITNNLRSWRLFFLMRTTKETHPDVKQITLPMLEEFKRVVPILYDDIVPGTRQVDNLRLPR